MVRSKKRKIKRLNSDEDIQYPRIRVLGSIMAKYFWYETILVISIYLIVKHFYKLFRKWKILFYNLKGGV